MKMRCSLGESEKGEIEREGGWKRKKGRAMKLESALESTIFLVDFGSVMAIL
jgi:hypothetical protein